MPDWKPEIRQHLAGLRLVPTREAAIVEELAQRLDDCYAELRSGGATEDEAHRAALAELSESKLLQRELRRGERQVTPEPVVLGTNRRTTMIAEVWQDLRFALFCRPNAQARKLFWLNQLSSSSFRLTGNCWQNSPLPREIELSSEGKIIAIPQVGGLHHRYRRAA
ncbi:MAG TPA: hypothetical protein VJ810_02665 [Blastocatellia bacterium]|nr:hypothetical protein [Blastocatellia bacterium]